MDWLLYGIAGAAAVLTLIVSLKSGKGVRYLAVSAGSGIAVLLLLTAFGSKIGLTVPLNPTNLLLSATGGFPGLAFTVALRYLL